MTPGTKLLNRCLMVLPWLAMLSALACEPIAYSTASTLSGVVTNEDAKAIINASITLVGAGQTVRTDADGLFSFASNGNNPNASVIAVSADGFAPQYRTYQWKDKNIWLGNITLRSVSVSQQITLSTSPNDVTSVQRMLGDAGAQVSFGYQALVTPAGVVAEGNATVSLTYWHPQGALDSIPGALVALDASGPSPLRTFGMLSIDVYQGTDKLQVAPGQTATLRFTVPSNMRAQMLAQAVPNLYWLDPNAGMWRLQGVAGDGNLALDANAGVFTAVVPHLSEWNMDGTYGFDNGGCISGKVYNVCTPSQGASNANISVWFLGVEELKRWDTVTDGAGNYCINVGIGPYQGTADDPRGFPISYMITTTADITEPGTMCDPLPPQCRTCNPEYATWSFPPCNDCVIAKPGVVGYVAPGSPPPPSYPDCSPPTPVAYIQRCHFCPGTAPGSCTNQQYNFDTGTNQNTPSAAFSGGCFQLQDISIKSAGCNCNGIGASCKTDKDCCNIGSGIPSVCSTAGVCVSCNKHLGEVCSATDGCCELGAGALDLDCSDNICIPTTDPSFSQ